MNEWLQALLLAVIQGVTEFLPISSSAHLVIPSLLLGWDDQGVAFDVALHVGTLLAVVAYYRDELIAMAVDFCRGPLAARNESSAHLVWYLLLASVPVAVCGVAAESFLASYARSLPVIATTTIVFALLLGYADSRGRAMTRHAELTLAIALAIGLAQALALVPGVSRSGVTITMGILLGLHSREAARFAFLLAIPAIAGAGLLKTADLIQGEVLTPAVILMLGAAVSGLVAYLSIALFMRLLERIGMMPFVWYRLLLGGLLFLFWLR